MQAEYQSCGVVLIQYLVHFLTDKALEFGIVRLELLAPWRDFGKDPVGGCLDQGRGGPCWCSSQRRRTQCQQDSEQSGDRSHGVFSWAVSFKSDCLSSALPKTNFEIRSSITTADCVSSISSPSASGSGSPPGRMRM